LLDLSNKPRIASINRRRRASIERRRSDDDEKPHSFAAAAAAVSKMVHSDIVYRTLQLVLCYCCISTVFDRIGSNTNSGSDGGSVFIHGFNVLPITTTARRAVSVAPLSAVLEKTTTTTTSTTPSETPQRSSKPTVTDELPLAPLTQWGQPYEDIVAIQKAAKEQTLPSFSTEVFAEDVLQVSAVSRTTAEQEALELQYFHEHRLDIIDKLNDHGCVIFRNFTLMATPDGFTQFYNALQMHVCCDPLHSVSARPTIAVTNTPNSNPKASPIYEAVNKESRKNFFIGMHNEFVGTRAPAGAAFVCFTSAPIGGEFLIADARRIFRELPANMIKTLYEKQIRYSVIELPFFTWIDTWMIEPLREPTASLIRNVVTFAMNQKVDFDIDLQWITNQESVYTNTNNNKNTHETSSLDTDADTTASSKPQPQRILQARAPKQPPILAHPITNDPVWFCNVHSHSAILRQQRESMYVVTYVLS
jgi:Taurine catabolism dioxygenase TauD, TfdA family